MAHQSPPTTTPPPSPIQLLQSVRRRRVSIHNLRVKSSAVCAWTLPHTFGIYMDGSLVSRIRNIIREFRGFATTAAVAYRGTGGVSGGEQIERVLHIR